MIQYHCSSSNSVFNIDPPEMPQDPAAVEIPSALVPCAYLVNWNPPNNINSLDIDYYVVQTSTQSKIDTVSETSTLAAFLSPCTELENLYINITAVDRCEREGMSTANFKPSILPSVFTTSSPIPCELIVYQNFSGRKVLQVGLHHEICDFSTILEKFRPYYVYTTYQN